MSTFNGDFLGFSFNGVSSSTLGLTRVSDGSRYNEELLPTSQDKTVQVPGGHGTYYFGSYYTQRTFSIPVAFDNVTESQFRLMRQTFQQGNMGKLVFDERPDRYYMAKSNGAQSIKYVCFDVDSQNIYKGEATLNFICYYPFAMSEIIINTLSSTGYTTILNNGDLDMNWKVSFPFNSSIGNTTISLQTSTGSTISTKSLSFTATKLSTDTGTILTVDSKSRLLGSNSGVIYNASLSGNFFTIPNGVYRLYISSSATPFTIEYQKLYF